MELLLTSYLALTSYFKLINSSLKCARDSELYNRIQYYKTGKRTWLWRESSIFKVLVVLDQSSLLQNLGTETYRGNRTRSMFLKLFSPTRFTIECKHTVTQHSTSDGTQNNSLRSCLRDTHLVRASVFTLSNSFNHPYTDHFRG